MLRPEKVPRHLVKELRISTQQLASVGSLTSSTPSVSDLPKFRPHSHRRGVEYNKLATRTPTGAFTGPWTSWHSKTISASASPSNSSTSAAMTSIVSSAARISSLAATATNNTTTQIAQITNAAIANLPTGSTTDGAANGAEHFQAQTENTRMIIIILSSALGSIILVISGLLLWHYYKRYQKRLHTIRLQTPEENEFDKWRFSSMPATAKMYSEPVPPTPTAAQSHISQRYYSRPTSAYPFDGQDSPGLASGLLHERSSSLGSPLEETTLPAHHYSSSVTSMRGYMQHRAERTSYTQSLTTRRAPTPLFGKDQAQGEDNEVPQVPSAKLLRPRLTRLSPLAGSPMSSEFDFGFHEQLSGRRSGRFSDASETAFIEPPAARPRHF